MKNQTIRVNLWHSFFIIIGVALMLAACSQTSAPEAAQPSDEPVDQAAEAETETEAEEAMVEVPLNEHFAQATTTSEGGMVDGSQYKKEGPYRIGFSNGFSGNSWRKMTLASIQLEAEKHPDLDELIILDGQGDVNKQINDIESLIAQEVDAILVIANSGTAVVPVLREANEAGIVTVPFNLPVDGEDYTAYVGVSPEKKGARNATHLRDAVGEGGKVVALGGLPGNSYTAAGWGAAEPILTEADIEVLAFRDTDWEEDKAKVIMSDLIAAHPQIDGAWSDGGQVVAGALKALMAANRPLMAVTGDDYNGLLRLYHENKDEHPEFTFSAISEPTWESALALRTALDLLRGKDVPKRLLIEPQTITPENYLDYYRSDLPDPVFVDTELPDDVLADIFGE